MLGRKVKLCALMLIALTACTKQELMPTAVTAEAMLNATSVQETVFGLMKEKTNFTMTMTQLISQTKQDMNKASMRMVRVPISLSQTTVNKTIDQYLAD